ncbi:hypothetical protein HHK36_030869 [Tetracentron sinense]|uniref:Dof zinc finger protein n=1 Tax=Tetracentron sinense TaxID=13715 RepID=A0A834YAK8_TETSI|nr:hypothetical protein HHK36_030869 [Tetracentron sinense]
MIQELLGGGAGQVTGGERKSSFNGGVLEASASPSPSPSPSSTTATTTSSSDHQNLKCPRCDSSNTKFCYYNNYNLTQPRHFCKTCRRYWTKGGALRSVPIGGGSRKIKNTGVSTAAGKIKLASSNIVQSNPESGFDHELPSNPILWASPQNPQLLALLRATQNPNPNSMSNYVTIKDEGTMIGSHMTSESAVATGALNGRTLSLDPLSQAPIGLCNSFWRNNQQHQQNLHQSQHSFLLGEVHNTGIQELDRRLRSSANYYTDHSQAVLMSNLSSTSPSSSLSTMEPAPIAGSELGYWNPALSWPNLPTTNGAYP